MAKLYLDVGEALHNSWRRNGALHLLQMAKLLLIIAPVKLITSLARGYTCSAQTQAGVHTPSSTVDPQHSQPSCDSGQLQPFGCP